MRSKRHWRRFCILMACATGCGQSPIVSQPAAEMTAAERLERDKYILVPDYLTFDEAREEVRRHDEVLKASLESFNPGKAHAAIHALVNLVPALRLSAANSQLNVDDRQQVQAATDILATAFGKLDASMHSDDAIKYADVQSQIAEGLRMLEVIDQPREKQPSAAATQGQTANVQ